ncbi:MAG: undecaprenyl/decaprenyl-phosphate alpha-N-acetylglucosaminyl 1-phosphate transferase [Treponema sp.]|nr:undecaprenyl/decaprenyl-phosphate alpha-N-acetylglucosaminyl 1-phosphate transferase [Treponema sp.]
MLICAAIAFVLCLLLIPLIIKLCKKYNWYDEVDPRKVHTGQIPRLGGVGIFISFFISLTIYIIFFNKTDLFHALPVLIGWLIIFLFGIVDDFMNLRAKLKFLIQIVAALVVSASPMYFNQIFGLVLPHFIGRFITFCWIIFLVNAYNLIDGLDLLCGGLSFITLLTGGFFLIFGGQDVGFVYIILCASILGFLVYNRPPAKIFLGDGGSQSLGFAIATIPLFTLQGGLEYTKLFTSLLLVSIPVTDVVAAVWRRTREHRSFFSADRAHIHHKLVNIGFSKTATAVCLLVIQLFICGACLSTLFMKKTLDAIILLTVCLGLVWAFFAMLHYINRSVNLKHTGHLSDAPQKEH